MSAGDNAEGPLPGDGLRPVDEAARALARRLLTTAGHGALAVIEAGSGHPSASRVAFALDQDGAPLILTSALAAHTPALATDPRCALLVGEPGGGDPLAHPRITLQGVARRLVRDSTEGRRARERYLQRHIAAVAAARAEGVPVGAYMVWSLMDNFEWASGYEKRFGIVHVDYSTLTRTLKDSARWYQGFLAGKQG